MNEADRRAEAERALKNAAEHGAVGDSFLAGRRGPAGEGDAIDRWGVVIGRGLAFLVAAGIVWYLLGGATPL